MDFSAITSNQKKRFSSRSELFDWIMMEVQSQMIQIEDHRRDKSPQMIDSIAALAALSQILAHAHDVTPQQILDSAAKLDK